MELDILDTQLLNHLRRLLTEIELHHLVLLTVCDKEGRLLVRPVPGDEVLNAVMKQQVARKTKDTTQLLRARETRKQGHRSTLREASEDNPGGLDTLVDLLLDESVEVLAGTEDTRLVLVADGFFEIQLYSH